MNTRYEDTASETLTNGMTDKELIDYCGIHCTSERALFSSEQINRMLELAGKPCNARFPPDGFYSLHEYMVELCSLARKRMKTIEESQFTSCNNVIDFAQYRAKKLAQ